MPVLSIDYSRGAASALYLDDNFSFEIVRVPMNSPYISYGNKPSKRDIFLDLLSNIEKKIEIKLDKKVKIYVSSLYKYNLGLENVIFCDKSEAFSSLYPLDFLYFSHLHVGDNSGVYSGGVDYKLLLKEIFFDEKEETLMNYFENFNLYPFMLASSDRDVYEEVAYLKQIAKNHCRIYDKGGHGDIKSIIFSTTRELKDERSMSRFMLLCVESICRAGIYSFKLDYSNFLGSISALSFLEPKIFQKVEMPEFVELGTVITAEEDLTCSFSIEEGPRQEVKLARGSIFTLPLSSYQKVNISVNSKKYGIIDKVLNGGVFGVVLDTRNRNYLMPQTLEQKKELEKTWEDILLTGFKNL